MIAFVSNWKALNACTSTAEGRRERSDVKCTFGQISSQNEARWRQNTTTRKREAHSAGVSKECPVGKKITRSRRQRGLPASMLHITKGADLFCSMGVQIKDAGKRCRVLGKVVYSCTTSYKSTRLRFGRPSWGKLGRRCFEYACPPLRKLRRVIAADHACCKSEQAGGQTQQAVSCQCTNTHTIFSILRVPIACHATNQTMPWQCYQTMPLPSCQVAKQCQMAAVKLSRRDEHTARRYHMPLPHCSGLVG